MASRWDFRRFGRWPCCWDPFPTPWWSLDLTIAFLTVTGFNVKVGQRLNLVIDNTDEGEHSITSPQVGVNIVIKPGIHTYRLVVKKQAASPGSA